VKGREGIDRARRIKPNLIDVDSGVERRATSRDIANIAFLINEPEGFDVLFISPLADDAPKGQFSLSRFYPALKHCLKPVRSSTPNMKDLMEVLELGYLIAGGKTVLISSIWEACSAVSRPLTMPRQS
jgi:trimethylamine--corrinoid protein Co-methyltransferase